MMEISDENIQYKIGYEGNLVISKSFILLYEKLFLSYFLNICDLKTFLNKSLIHF